MFILPVDVCVLREMLILAHLESFHNELVAARQQPTARFRSTNAVKEQLLMTKTTVSTASLQAALWFA
jgi:hypothetical protein